MVEWLAATAESRGIPVVQQIAGAVDDVREALVQAEMSGAQRGTLEGSIQKVDEAACRRTAQTLGLEMDEEEGRRQ